VPSSAGISLPFQSSPAGQIGYTVLETFRTNSFPAGRPEIAQRLQIMHNPISLAITPLLFVH
jgi:hypothetical protein